MKIIFFKDVSRLDSDYHTTHAESISTVKDLECVYHNNAGVMESFTACLKKMKLAAQKVHNYMRLY